MKQVMPYLMFSGTCHEALHFYKDALDGEIVSMQQIKDSPLSAHASEEDADRIFDSEFVAENVRFKASDDMPGSEVNVGSNFAMFVHFTDAAEQEKVFERLSDGGHVQFPLNDGFGMVVDRFRVQWMLAKEN